ncbi:MAG: hypothetical protein DLM58_15795 [Pseudonocardiales bacterium]|nr:MAG: hypothetical protein DLM58_15795 [Pseudonocardiales bacterium]
MKWLAVFTCLLSALVLSGCSTVTQGSGQHTGPAVTTAAGSPDFPTGSASTSQSSAPPPPVTTPPSTQPPAAPTRQQREDRLTAQTNGQAHVLVQVSGGFEAASFDQHTNIQFWRSVGNTVSWTQIGQSSYPYSPAVGSPAQATVHGALLSRMQHATFILTANLTGDGSGNDVAYTTGARGWGVIKAEPNGNIGPSGQPVGEDKIGLAYHFAFASGRLKTEDCPSDKPIASCGTDHVDKLWLWTGSDFARV